MGASPVPTRLAYVQKSRYNAKLHQLPSEGRGEVKQSIEATTTEPERSRSQRKVLAHDLQCASELDATMGVDDVQGSPASAITNATFVSECHGDMWRSDSSSTAPDFLGVADEPESTDTWIRTFTHSAVSPLKNVAGHLVDVASSPTVSTALHTIAFLMQPPLYVVVTVGRRTRYG